MNTCAKRANYRSKLPDPVQKQAAETLEPMLVAAQNQADLSCSLDNPENCEACGS